MPGGGDDDAPDVEEGIAHSKEYLENKVKILMMERPSAEEFFAKNRRRLAGAQRCSFVLMCSSS